MRGEAKISIIVPSLNQGEFIEEALSSILRQEDVRREEFELIVIDGGSTDRTIDVLCRLGHELEYWVSEPDSGQTNALQKGFGVAKGEILGWLCADDLLTPRALRSVLDFFSSNPRTSFVYGDAIWIALDGQPERIKREIPFSWFIWLHDHNYIPQPSAFWRRGLYAAVGGLDPRFDLAMDAELFAKFAVVEKPRHVSRIWSLVRQHPAQKTQRFRDRSSEEVRLVQQRYGVEFDHGPLAQLKFLSAKLMRVLWKASRGGYVPQALTRRIWAREMRREISA